jgi:hypothetical protein
VRFLERDIRQEHPEGRFDLILCATRSSPTSSYRCRLVLPSASLNCYWLLDYLAEGFVEAIQQFNPISGAFEICTWFGPEGSGLPAGTDFPIHLGQGLLLHMHVPEFVPLPGWE